MSRKPTDMVQLKLRFTELLRRRLAREAARNGRSMNTEIIHRLEESLEEVTFDDAAFKAMQEAFRMDRAGFEGEAREKLAEIEVTMKRIATVLDSAGLPDPVAARKAEERKAQKAAQTEIERRIYEAITAERKRELIAKLIKVAPEMSDREIAETVEALAGPTTVEDVRLVMGEAEARRAAEASIPELTDKDDNGGKQ